MGWSEILFIVVVSLTVLYVFGSVFIPGCYEHRVLAREWRFFMLYKGYLMKEKDREAGFERWIKSRRRRGKI